MSAKLVKTTTKGIYKRGSRYVVTFRDPYGKQRRRSARTLAEARALKAQLVADVSRGEYRPLSKVTFTEYATEWIASYSGRTSRGVRDATRDDYRRRLEREAIPFFGRMPLAAIEPGDIKRYAQRLADLGLAPSTVRLAVAPVKALLATAVEEGIIRSNPSAGVRMPWNGNGDHKEQAKALTEEELAQLLAEIPAEWRLFFEVLAQTGMRIGEAVAVRWSDVDFDRRQLRVERRWYRGGFAPPKSKYGRRTIPLSRRLASELEALWLLQDDPEGLIFRSSTGTVVDGGNLAQRVLKPAARRAGVPWAHFHMLRHTCATMLFRRGVNAKQVQMWMGHHSPAFTLAVYVELLPDDLPDGDVLEGDNKVATRPPETSRNGDGREGAESRISPRSNSAQLEVGRFF